MHIVVFGLSISSSWGNGHATIWRSLASAMAARGHTLTFFEKDVPYYAAARDLRSLEPYGRLVLYPDFDEVLGLARIELDRASLAICTSYCPDALVAADMILESRAEIKCFYDLDSPVTLDALAAGRAVPYLPAYGLGPFDLVLSFTGGRVLEELRSRLGARVVAPLYGSVDPKSHVRTRERDDLRCVLSYLGTYAEDRQVALEELFWRSAEKLPNSRFLLCGSQYPTRAELIANVTMLHHLPPGEHAAFYSSSRTTLNLTRRAMADYGFCPSGRLFEAAACGTAILSDLWEGLGTFFEFEREILVVTSTQDVLNALSLSDAELKEVGDAAQARVLKDHTGEARIKELESLCDMVASRAIG